MSVLASGPEDAVTVWALPQYASAIRIYVDGLSAVFLLLIAVVSALSALYSIQYMEHYPDYGLYRYYPYFLLFVAGMYGIVIVTDLMAGFFLLWQLMTSSSYFLGSVRIPEPRERPRRQPVSHRRWKLPAPSSSSARASWPMGRLPWGRDAAMRYDFDAISHGMPVLLQTGAAWPPQACCVRDRVRVQGRRMAFWPVVATRRSPAAPSPVSALLSGVMIKTGIYGLMRSFLWLVPAEAADVYPSEIWGLAIAVLATATLFIGTTKAEGRMSPSDSSPSAASARWAISSSPWAPVSR